jgi:hypothetical protein
VASGRVVIGNPPFLGMSRKCRERPAGLVATNSIHGGANRKVLQVITERSRILLHSSRFHELWSLRMGTSRDFRVKSAFSPRK